MNRTVAATPGVLTDQQPGRVVTADVGNLASGTVAEWTIAPALKADDLHGSGGSNPPRSANQGLRATPSVNHTHGFGPLA